MNITIGNQDAGPVCTANLAAKRIVPDRFLETICEIKVLVKSRRQKKRKVS